MKNSKLRWNNQPVSDQRRIIINRCENHRSKVICECKTNRSSCLLWVNNVRRPANNCQSESKCVSRKSRLEWNARFAFFSWIMTFVEHIYSMTNFLILKYVVIIWVRFSANLISVWNVIFGVWCVVFTIINVFACVRLGNQRAKTIAAFSKHDPIFYAGHISHLFKITAILIGVFLFRFCFHLSTWTFHFCMERS